MFQVPTTPGPPTLATVARPMTGPSRVGPACTVTALPVRSFAPPLTTQRRLSST